MSAARSLSPAEQWITPPEPALNRYLLCARPRAHNDNGGLTLKTLPLLPISACLVLVGAGALIASLI